MPSTPGDCRSVQGRRHAALQRRHDGECLHELDQRGGAGLALLAVVALGVWLHRPLANVPENALKFGVGVMLAAFGTFWAGEGIGLSWLGEDWAILALIGVFAVVALAMVHLFKRVMGLFVDDGWLAIGVVAWVMASWEMEAMHAVTAARAGPLFAVGLTVLLAASAVRRART